ncbi:MAG: DUF3604 domain-containing protein [Armatimonadota bacterium]
MRRDHGTSGNGTVSVDIASREIVVGRRYCMTMIYTAGPQGVAVGGALRFKLPGFDLAKIRRVPAICSNPRVTLEASNVLPAVNGKNGSEFFTIDYLFLTVKGAPLAEGDWVALRYGYDLALRHTAAPVMAQQWAVEVATDVDGSRGAPGSGFYLVKDPPVLSFVNDAPLYLEITIPSSTQVGTPFEAVVRARDQYHNICADHRGAVKVQDGPDGASSAADTSALVPHDGGVQVLPGCVLQQAGIHRITVVDEELGLYARSNATRTTIDAPPYRLYWGDTHCHSSISADSAANNALIPRPREDYHYARHRAHLDFCMVTDHIEDQSEEDWRETREAASACYEPGRFVTFSGFEATFQPLRAEGDKNVYFLADDEAWFNAGSTQDLYDDLKRRPGGAMVIPHLHVPTNWERHDPALERVVEIYAHWGCGLSPDSEPPLVPPGRDRPRESYLSHALEQGAKLGFIASADHSYGHPGDDFWWGLSSYTGGLAAVYGASLTREGIWDALWERRCYATTRARILLEFEMNGHCMGQEFSAGRGEARRLTVRAYGTAPIASVDIVRNGRTVHSQAGDGRIDVELTYVDREPERDTDYYYVHVTQVDREQAWSSPIWVSTG